MTTIYAQGKEYTKEALQSDHDRLKPIFDKICNAEDWKAPISVVCRGEDISAIVEAIRFFTGTIARVSLGNMNAFPGVGFIPYVVESEGYRLGPCGDN